MTKRQAEALEWLQRYGKVTEGLVRKHGFQVRTFDALADAGHITRDYVPQRRIPFGTFKVFTAPTTIEQQTAWAELVGPRSKA